MISSIAIPNEKLTKLFEKHYYLYYLKTFLILLKKYCFIFKNNISYYLYPKDYYVIFLSVSAYKIIFLGGFFREKEFINNRPGF